MTDQERDELRVIVLEVLHEVVDDTLRTLLCGSETSASRAFESLEAVVLGRLDAQRAEARRYGGPR